MDKDTMLALAAIAGAATSAYQVWLRRTVDSATARKLRAETTDIIQEAAEKQIERLEAEIARLEERVEALEETVRRLRLENERLRTQNDELARRLTDYVTEQGGE